MARQRTTTRRRQTSRQEQAVEQQEQTTEARMTTGAAIDIGSNSTEVTIAHCTPAHLEILQEQSRMVRLGESIEESGEITPDRRDDVIAIVREYIEIARQNDAERIMAVATQATRQARNRDAFLEDIQRETGQPVNLISGEIEAALTYHGVVSELDVPPDVGVLDVGGSSTELVTARDGHITWLISLPIGSGWLHDHYLISDPPTEDEITEAQKFLHDYLRALHVPEQPPALIVTGSSAKELLKICQQALNKDESSKSMDRQDLVACQGLLNSLPALEVAQRYGQDVERARVLPGGALLILEMMNYLKQDEVRVTNRGVPEGVLLSYARYGDHWLDHDEVKVEDKRIGKVPALPKETVQSEQAQRREETFIEAGRKELPRRVKKFVEWRDEVLKDEDIENVHRMRVASRRLRATLDAYETICKPKAFKEAYRRVQQAADLLGRVRDTDVMLQHIQEQEEQYSTQEQAGMQWLVDRLKLYRNEQVKELNSFLRKFDEEALQQQIEKGIVKGASSNGKGQTH